MKCFYQGVLKILRWIPVSLFLAYTASMPFLHLESPGVGLLAGITCIIFTYPKLVSRLDEFGVASLRLKLRNSIKAFHMLIHFLAKESFIRIGSGSNRMLSSDLPNTLKDVDNKLRKANEIEKGMGEEGIPLKEITVEKRAVHAYNVFDLFDIAYKTIEFKAREHLRDRFEKIGCDLIYDEKFSQIIYQLEILTEHIKRTIDPKALEEFNSRIIHFEKYLENHKEEL